MQLLGTISNFIALSELSDTSLKSAIIIYHLKISLLKVSFSTPRSQVSIVAQNSSPFLKVGSTRPNCNALQMNKCGEKLRSALNVISALFQVFTCSLISEHVRLE